MREHIKREAMTPQEALKVIDKAHDYPCPYGIGGTAWMYIRSCIEKQIPKKPEKSYDGYADGNPVIEYHCPNCYREVDEDELEHYCHCGQALDWSDTE